MTIEQTVEIPANRRIFLDLPLYLPVGKAKVELTVTPEENHASVMQCFSVSADRCDASNEKTEKSLRSLLGIHKGLDTMDAYFERKRADKAKEDALFEQSLQKVL